METNGSGKIINSRAQSIVLLLITGFLWSLGGVFIKTTDAHPLVISCIRSFSAAICLFVYLRGKPRFVFTRVQFAGALCYAGTVTVFITATKLTTSANAILLQYSSPVFVAILGWLILKEALYWYDYLSMGGVAAGLVFLLSGSIGFDSIAGSVLAILSGLFYASLMILLKLHKDGSRVETLLLGNLFAALVGLPFLFINPAPISALPPVIFLGVFQIAIPYILFAKASERAPALDLALLPIVEPLLNPVWVFLVTGEQPAALTYIGGIILLGVITFRSLIVLRTGEASQKT